MSSTCGKAMPFGNVMKTNKHKQPGTLSQDCGHCGDAVADFRCDCMGYCGC